MNSESKLCRLRVLLDPDYGLGTLETGLATEGTRKIRAVNQAVQPAKSWMGVQ